MSKGSEKSQNFTGNLSKVVKRQKAVISESDQCKWQYLASKSPIFSFSLKSNGSSDTLTAFCR